MLNEAHRTTLQRITQGIVLSAGATAIIYSLSPEEAAHADNLQPAATSEGYQVLADGSPAPVIDLPGNSSHEEKPSPAASRPAADTASSENSTDSNSAAPSHQAAAPPPLSLPGNENTVVPPKSNPWPKPHSPEKPTAPAPVAPPAPAVALPGNTSRPAGENGSSTPLPPVPAQTPLPTAPASTAPNASTGAGSSETSTSAPPQANTDPNGKTGPNPDPTQSTAPNANQAPAPSPPPAPATANTAVAHTPETQPDKITVFKPVLDLIASKESGGDYDNYFGRGNGRHINLTSMTINQVLAWQSQYVADGSPSSAAGRYQFINKTLSGLVHSQGIDPNALFDEHMQDRLAMVLFDNCGADDFLSGKISWQDFAHALARQWASLPSVTGLRPDESVYESGLNHALISVPQIEQALAAVKH